MPNVINYEEGDYFEAVPRAARNYNTGFTTETPTIGQLWPRGAGNG